jgi:hypothetical protein
MTERDGFDAWAEENGELPTVVVDDAAVVIREDWRRLPTRRLVAVMDREDQAGNDELVELMAFELMARDHERSRLQDEYDDANPALEPAWWEAR